MNRSREIAANDGTIRPSARILVVDDEPDGAKSLGILLRLRGYTVEVLTDSTQCQGLLESFRPDVVLLDIAMPRISGYELATQIRAQREFDRMAIIAASGYTDSEHTRRSLEAGCDFHLAKPVQLAALEIAIARELAKRLSRFPKP